MICAGLQADTAIHEGDKTMNRKVKITIAISAIALTVAGVIAAKSVFNKEAPILEYESVSDVIKNADNVIGTTYQNFSLPDSISIDASDQLYEIKADYWSKKLGTVVLAEDSGIEIQALNGYPGVYTKRCVEDLCPGADINVDKPGELYPLLLKLMKESGNPSTVAHWVSAVALAMNGIVVSTEEALKGNMCEAAGKTEFGFDQYFKPENCTQTLSELEPTVKDAIGPRKKAFETILKELLA